MSMVDSGREMLTFIGSTVTALLQGPLPSGQVQPEKLLESGGNFRERMRSP